MYQPFRERQPVDDRDWATDPEENEDRENEYPKIPSKTPIARLLQAPLRRVKALVA